LEQAGYTGQAAAARQEADRERQTLLRRLDALQAEVEQIWLATGGTPQVLVSMQIIELPATKLRRLGFDMTKVLGDPSAKPGAAAGAANPLGFQVVDGNQVQQLVETLRKDNLVRVLAEPILVTTSGRSGAYNNGGELPLPMPQKDGTVAIEFIHYGTQAEVTADVLDQRTLRLAIHCRVAELDPEHTVQVGQQTVPGIQVREFTTNLETQDGQTVVITGPTQKRVEAHEEGVPVVGNVPFLNRVFVGRRVEEQNDVTMVVLVRPEIVRPRAAVARDVGNAAPPPQVVRPAVGPSDVPPTTAHRPADGDVRR
jgi:pilus assembly protein CpaC